MELEEMIRSALARFHGNLYWREYYEKAPSEACRKWIELSFVYPKSRVISTQNIRRQERPVCPGTYGHVQ